MKQIGLYIIISIFAFTACNKNCCKEKDCQPKIPNDIKAIDWENYNDVYTIFWNCYGLCSDEHIYDDSIVKICGWCVVRFDLFSLCDDAKHSTWDPSITLGSAIFIVIDLPHNVNNLLKSQIDSAGRPLKFYITGKIRSYCPETGVCQNSVPRIVVENQNDIYFK